MKDGFVRVAAATPQVSVANVEENARRVGEMVRQAAEAGQIDQIRLTILPVLLGGGFRLFGEREESTFLHLTDCCRRGEMVECIYDRR